MPASRASSANTASATAGRPPDANPRPRPKARHQTGAARLGGAGGAVLLLHAARRDGAAAGAGPVPRAAPHRGGHLDVVQRPRRPVPRPAREPPRLRLAARPSHREPHSPRRRRERLGRCGNPRAALRRQRSGRERRRQLRFGARRSRGRPVRPPAHPGRRQGVSGLRLPAARQRGPHPLELHPPGRRGGARHRDAAGTGRGAGGGGQGAGRHHGVLDAGRLALRRDRRPGNPDQGLLHRHRRRHRGGAQDVPRPARLGALLRPFVRGRGRSGVAGSARHRADAAGGRQGELQLGDLPLARAGEHHRGAWLFGCPHPGDRRRAARPRGHRQLWRRDAAGAGPHPRPQGAQLVPRHPPTVRGRRRRSTGCHRLAGARRSLGRRPHHGAARGGWRRRGHHGGASDHLQGRHLGRGGRGAEHRGDPRLPARGVRAGGAGVVGEPVGGVHRPARVRRAPRLAHPPPAARGRRRHRRAWPAHQAVPRCGAWRRRRNRRPVAQRVEHAGAAAPTHAFPGEDAAHPAP